MFPIRGQQIFLPNSFMKNISRTLTSSSSILLLGRLKDNDGLTNDDLRNEIEQMKKDAIKKINDLDASVSSEKQSTTTMSPSSTATATSTKSTSDNRNAQNVDDKESLVEQVKASTINKPAFTNTYRDIISLLDDTSWKLSFDVGREPGTWMPSTWAANGERLFLNLDIDFTNDQLYEREEFLGSMGGAKVLKIKNNELTMTPSITEGMKTVRVKDGGWRVAQGAGPMGTDLLRFYIEIEEELRHKGSDVYCPAGRIYANCGYFPTMNQSSQYKDSLKKELDNMIIRAEELDDEIAAEGPFSLNRFKKSSELFRLKVDMQSTAERFASASVASPDKSLLKYSQDGDVGLTREGGICCKVIKPMTVEYHILGRFRIAASKEN